MNDAASPGAEQEHWHGVNRGMITVSIMLATIIQTLDMTIANVALPHMQGSLSASQDQIAWVLTSYIVAVAIATPLTGWMCDRFSIKAVFLVSVAGFTAASVLCGTSISLAEIVVARLLQGAFGASLVPLSQAVLLDINPPEKRGSAMAMWGVGVMVAPILGPTLGGWLIESYGWRWVFFINVPVGAAAYFGIWKYIRHVPGSRRAAFDFFGFATLSIAIGALQLLLDRGEQNNWFSSPETWAEAIVLGVSFSYFVAHTVLMPAGKSFFDYRLLKDRNFISGSLFVFIIGLVLFATRALMPTMLQNLMDYPVFTAGLVTAPSGIGSMAAMLIVGRLVGRVDLRLLLFVGFAITGVALWQMSGYALMLSESTIVWPTVIQGFGLGLIWVPLATASFATLPSALRAEGTAIFSLVRNIGSSIGISLVQTLLVRNTQIAHASLVEKMSLAGTSLRGISAAAAREPAHAPVLALLNHEVTRQSMMIGYVDDYWLMLVLTVMVVPLLLVLRSAKHSAVGRAEQVAMD